MLDADGYPLEASLKALREYDILAQPMSGFLALLKETWKYAEGPGWCGYWLRGKRVLYLELHTGGWSGNEDVISELEKTIFWIFYWTRTERGGHYYFRIPIRQLQGVRIGATK